MTRLEGYPLNFNFWDEKKHYQAMLDTLQDWNPSVLVTVIGHEDVICNFHGYDIPDGFMLVRMPDGTVTGVHKRWLHEP